MIIYVNTGWWLFYPSDIPEWKVIKSKIKCLHVPNHQPDNLGNITTLWNFVY